MLRLLVLEAVKYSNQTPNVILEHLNGVRSRLTLYAAIDTLEYLKKGGRLKAGAATVGTLLNIKPIVTVNGEGEVEIAGKQIGFKKALNFILEKIKSMPIDENYPIYFIYSMAEKNCDALIRLSGTSGEKYNISAVIGAHIGAGAAGIAYVRKTV